MRDKYASQESMEKDVERMSELRAEKLQMMLSNGFGKSLQRCSEVSI